MKLALIGYGKMGKMIETIAVSRGHCIVARLSSSQWEGEELEEADLCLEFSEPSSVLENMKKVARMKKNAVIGTTGWETQLEEMRSLVQENQIGTLYSSNFSVGMHLFFHLLNDFAQVMNAFEEYDVAGIEYHHRGKKDCPSGTALEMARLIEKQMQRVNPLSFTSVRCGSIPGIHSICFDSPQDTLTLTHEARNREGFAKGAIQAAEWMSEKKGFYTFTDYLGERMEILRH